MSTDSRFQLRVICMFPTDAPIRKAWPFRSHAQVVIWRDEQPRIHRIARRLFDRELCLWEYAGLCGAPDDAVVEIDVLDSGLCLDFYQPQRFSYTGLRLIQGGRNGLTLIDDSLYVRDGQLQREGLERQIFRREVRHSQRLGVRRICVQADRRNGEYGHYLWPQMGFDGRLPQSVRRQLPHPLQTAYSVLDLMETELGRQWWREYGVSIQLVFDMAPASRSWHVFSSYWS